MSTSIQPQNIKNQLQQLEQLFELNQSLVSLSRSEFSTNMGTFRNNRYRTGYVDVNIDLQNLVLSNLFITYRVFVPVR